MKNKKTKLVRLDYNQAREELRRWIFKWTRGCDVQSGYVNGKKEDFGWSCGTCFINLLDKIGLKPSSLDYHERNNKNVDRSNEVWRAILQIRDARILKLKKLK